MTSSKFSKKVLKAVLPSLMVSACMIVVLAACGSDDEQPQTSSEPKSAQTAPPEPTTISIMAPLHVAQTPKDTILKQMESMSNTKLAIQWVPNAIYKDKLTTGIATNTLPQSVVVGNADIVLAKGAIRSGMFWEIGPYLKDYKNLSKLNPTVLNNSKIDGKVYGLYTQGPLSRQGIIVRKDWLDSLGLQMPKTIDELYTVLKKFTEGDPDKNGVNDTIGLADRADLIYGAFKTLASYFGAPNNYGLQDGKIVPDFMTPEYADTMKFMKKLYDEKLINSDFAVTSKEQQINLFTQGKSGVYIGVMVDGVSMLTNGKKLNPNYKLDVANRIAGPKGERVWSFPGYSGQYLFPKTAVKTEADLKNILAFYDRTLDADLGNLMEYGNDGVHYDLKDGFVNIRSDNDSKALIDQDLTPIQALQVAQNNIVDLKKPVFSDELRKKAEELIVDNEKILVNDPAAALESQTLDRKGAELKKIMDDATYQFMLGKLDANGFQAEVEKWKKSGGDQVMTELNEQFAKYGSGK